MTNQESLSKKRNSHVDALSQERDKHDYQTQENRRSWFHYREDGNRKRNIYGDAESKHNEDDVAQKRK